MQIWKFSVSDSLPGLDYQPYCSFPGKYQTQSSYGTPANEEIQMRKGSPIKKKNLGELHYERPTSFQGEAYQHTIDLKKEITEDVRNADQIQQPSGIQAPSSRVMKGLRTSVIQQTHSLPKR